MKRHFLPGSAMTFVAFSVLVFAPLPAAAQSGAMAGASAAPAASASVPVRSGAHLMTRTEMRNTKTPPGDVRPETPVIRQVVIPLSKTPPAPLKPETRAMRSGHSASAGGINDDAARCGALAGAQARANCRDKPATGSRGAAPG
jgi:hypothetical protein